MKSKPIVILDCLLFEIRRNFLYPLKCVACVRACLSSPIDVAFLRMTKSYKQVIFEKFIQIEDLSFFVENTYKIR